MVESARVLAAADANLGRLVIELIIIAVIALTALFVLIAKFGNFLTHRKDPGRGYLGSNQRKRYQQELSRRRETAERLTQANQTSVEGAATPPAEEPGAS
ncbi:MAG TPA: hypothetical protein VHZ96_17545 [Frankiaceae bacterium]|jgi:hypothetical protein|nr:hypothetical protein [Frankiaceae bacterium]